MRDDNDLKSLLKGVKTQTNNDHKWGGGWNHYDLKLTHIHTNPSQTYMQPNSHLQRLSNHKDTLTLKEQNTHTHTETHTDCD